MNQSHSDRIKDFFAVHSHDITPVPVRHAARVLYAPVSNDPEITRCCASVLSETELHRADRFIKQGDRSLFIQRRAFRRFYGALSLGSSKSLSQVVFEETENGRPYLSDLPDFWFSFSSCRFGFLGAWSSMHGIGVDIEDRTRDPGASDLAREFFSAAEARAVEEHSGQANLQTFFQFWSLKEAALKSIGEGLPYGLAAFEFEFDPNLQVVKAPPDHGGPGQFSAHVMEGTEHCAALVIRSDLN
jgi:phosphopantetheine--protein transferase-like protein